jgi:ribosomal protein S18 acetylase RimI-like enzyme
VGRELADAVARGLGERHVQEFKVVVGADNDAANRFYERLGFRSAGRTAVHGDAQSEVWVMTCSS